MSDATEVLKPMSCMSWKLLIAVCVAFLRAAVCGFSRLARLQILGLWSRRAAKAETTAHALYAPVGFFGPGGPMNSSMT